MPAPCLKYKQKYSTYDNGGAYYPKKGAKWSKTNPKKGAT
jgi:hypothetical protein